MESFNRVMQVRWSDLDPNFHVRHSVYYDWGACCRVEYLNMIGFSGEVMQQLQIGPIIFREECLFRKEIRMNDKVVIELRILKAKKDFSRLSFQHRIMKNGDLLAATLTVDFAWMDMVKRKLVVLPGEIQQMFLEAPLTEDFQWVD